MSNLLLIIITFFFPFIGVFLTRGISGALLINILLCLLFYIPGVIHGLWVVVNAKQE